jgi:hypothetical protein
MSKPGANLNLVLSVMVAMSRTGGTKELASILDEGVVWQGLLPELVCNGRGEVLDILGRAPFPPITRVEAEEVGDRVVVIGTGTADPRCDFSDFRAASSRSAQAPAAVTG